MPPPPPLMIKAAALLLLCLFCLLGWSNSLIIHHVVGLFEKMQQEHALSFIHFDQKTELNISVGPNCRFSGVPCQYTKIFPLNLL